MKNYLFSYITLILSLLAIPLLAEETVKSTVYVGENGIAAEGFDVTTFFGEGEPERGGIDYQTEYNGADWYFINEENLNRFKENPEKFAPQYGGYCAWSVSRGRISDGFADLSMVHDGKLYFLCSNRALEKWSESIERNVQNADRHWPDVLQIIPEQSQKSEY